MNFQNKKCSKSIKLSTRKNFKCARTNARAIFYSIFQSFEKIIFSCFFFGVCDYEHLCCLRDIGPRHTPNPSTLRIFCHQKITNKKLLAFSEKLYEHFKIILQHLLKLYIRHYPLKKTPDFDLQDFENFVFEGGYF